MDVTFLAKVKADYPFLRIIPGGRFVFRPPKTIVYDKNSFNSLLFLHEVGHALSQRYDFKTEVERLRIEVMAWEKARELCRKYGVYIDEDLIETELDTYRDYLHQKSRCPRCGLTRFQTSDKIFHCPRCDIK